MSDYCNGCLTKSGPAPELDCVYIRFNENGVCPCTHCVIKVMCDIQCEDYDTWTKPLEVKFKGNENSG